MTFLFIKLIALYQRTLSPDHGPMRGFYPNGFCRYYPSCSEYAKQALAAHGLVRGLFLSVKRILKCNPFAGYGFDRVPDKHS